MLFGTIWKFIPALSRYRLKADKTGLILENKPDQSSTKQSEQAAAIIAGLNVNIPFIGEPDFHPGITAI